MAEQNVVKITEETDGAKAPTARCLSELVSVTMDKAAARLSSVDTDAIFREATLKAGIRDFAQALSGHFPELRDKIPSFFNATSSMGGPIRGASSNLKSPE